MKNGNRTKGRYQTKKELGLVPFHYDRDSKSFNEGAWKNWPHARDRETRQISGTQKEENRDVKNDAFFLAKRQTNYHQFTELP